MSNTIIDTRGLKKAYGMGDIQINALNGVDMQVREGEFVSIMGPSGSGKSTLMNILGCLDRPTEGQYLLDGMDVSNHSRQKLAQIRNEKLGFVFQSYNLLPRFTALENVTLPLLYQRDHRTAVKERAQKAEEKLVEVGLPDRMHHLPAELSGGQQQRVAIARALINDPVLILADEPTGNLDTRSGTEIMDLLHRLHSTGRTIVIVTHDSAVAATTERIISLRDGKVEVDRSNGYHTEVTL
ncbi:MAG: ABC transporter ATP-binding protein [Chloroflexi bacterium]|nr:ABC transporter ATP-binding protein [Chloroflexota bacterium]